MHVTASAFYVRLFYSSNLVQDAATVQW